MTLPMRIAARWGLTIGLVNLVWLYVSYWLGLHTNGVLLFQIVPAVWLAITATGYALALRELHRGTIPRVATGMRAGAVIALITAAIGVVMQIGYWTVVHPEWPAVMVAQTHDYFAARGASDAEIAVRVAAARESFTLPRYAAGSAISALVAGLVLSPVVSLVQVWRYRQGALRFTRR